MRASARNRWAMELWMASSGWTALTATSRASVTSRARNTTPMPPRPSSGPSSYWAPRAACRRAASPGPASGLVTRGLHVRGRSSETGGWAAPSTGSSKYTPAPFHTGRSSGWMHAARKGLLRRPCRPRSGWTAVEGRRLTWPSPHHYGAVPCLIHPRPPRPSADHRRRAPPRRAPEGRGRRPRAASRCCTATACRRRCARSGSGRWTAFSSPCTAALPTRSRRCAAWCTTSRASPPWRWSPPTTPPPARRCSSSARPGCGRWWTSRGPPAGSGCGSSWPRP